MILFEQISYKNFLASGNTPIKINLSDHDTTLIVGQNGAGKSTLIEAIVFALFNKSFRKINKSQLVNSINEKDCVVEVSFSIGRNKYKVIRGMKPSLFEIWCNGKMQNQDSHVNDQQKHLEQNILKLNYKSFTQIVILGSASFVPFMQLSAPNRREIIEDLLDIRIFSTMNVLLKDRVKVAAEEYRDNSKEVDFLKEKAEMQQDHLKRMEKTAMKTVEQKQKTITKFEGKNIELEKVINEFQEKIETFTDLDNVKILKDIKAVEKKITTNTNLIKRTEKEKTFFETHDECPKCTQSITKELKKFHIEENQKTIDASEDYLQELDDEITVLNKDLQRIADNNAEVSSYNFEVKSKLNEIQFIKSNK